MIDMIDNNLIYQQNPWWQRPEAINNDPRIVALNNLPLVWHPPFIDSLDISNDAVHILTGPRQIGKSTSIRFLIQDMLLKKNTPPKNVFLFNCDILNNPRELAEIVMFYLDNVAMPGRKYIFLDEVTAVENWPNGIKWLIDTGKGAECVYILTGSSSIKLKKSGEFLPGRRGKGRDLSLRPLKFRDYVGLVKPGVARPLPPEAGFSEIKKYYSDLLLAAPEFPALFERYCLHGGFLKPMNELHSSGLIQPETVDIYLSWIRGELAKDKKREHIGRLLLEKMRLSLGTGLSYQAFGEYMDVASHNTARTYLDFFIDSFIVNEVPFIEISQKRVAWRKNRKYYFSDPFIYWIITNWGQGGGSITQVFKEMFNVPEIAGALIENVVENHLCHWGDHLGYGAAQGREIDFVIIAKDTGVEVKFQNKVTSYDAAALKPFKRSYLVSKNTLEDMGHAIAIPAHLFCMIEL